MSFFNKFKNIIIVIALAIIIFYAGCIKRMHDTDKKIKLKVIEYNNSPTRLLPNDTIKIMSYNINGLPWPIRSGKKKAYEYIANELYNNRENGTGPGIVLIQEGFTNTVNTIIEKSGYKYVIKPINVLGILNSGLYILSDYPIVNAYEISYGTTIAGWDALANKGVLLFSIILPNGEKLNLINTHLNSVNSSGVSQEKSFLAQKKQLYIIDNNLKMIDRNDHTVFGGDFNIKTHQPNYEFMLSKLNVSDSYDDCLQNDDCDGANDKRHIDVVDHFLYESDTLEISDIRRTFLGGSTDFKLSDHSALVVTYKFK